jgi:hypothetical protein
MTKPYKYCHSGPRFRGDKLKPESTLCLPFGFSFGLLTKREMDSVIKFSAENFSSE